MGQSQQPARGGSAVVRGQGKGGCQGLRNGPAPCEHSLSLTVILVGQFGYTPLYYAVISKHCRVAEVLLAGGADTEMSDYVSAHILRLCAADLGSWMDRMGRLLSTEPPN